MSGHWRDPLAIFLPLAITSLALTFTGAAGGDVDAFEHGVSNLAACSTDRE
jgi:hypothetical protein